MSSSWSWSGYATALSTRGLVSQDVDVLVACARSMTDPKDAEVSLFEGLGARLPRSEGELLFGTVVEAQARGPQPGPRFDAWRTLFVEGCPLDHIHRVLWHSFKEPDADPQDWVWVTPERASANVERYVRLEFPRTGSANIFGPGLGCETLHANTRAAVAEYLHMEGSHSPLAQTLNLCRNTLSPRLRALVDANAQLHASNAARPSVREPWQDELLDLDGVRAETIAAWFASLDALFAADQIVHDVSADRFNLRDEPMSERRIRRRALPERPEQYSPVLEDTVAEWRTRNSEWGDSTTLSDLDFQDPLLWLTTVARMV